MKTNIKELKNVKLTDEQCDTVKHYIIDSLRGAYVGQGVLPGDGFEVASRQIAEGILKKVQVSLIQGAVFTNAVESSQKKAVKKVAKKAVKKVVKKAVKKVAKKAVKKTKKNVR